MPKRVDLKSILVIGAGPIIIGQACEFDYAGSQACLALREEGYRVILVNSNPSTIMTDSESSDVTYIEPLTFETIASIIAKERPDAILPTMGGQTALNLVVELEKKGILSKYNTSLIGTNIDSIHIAEDRQLFYQTMVHIGLDLPKSKKAKSMQEVYRSAKEIGFPIMVRPSFALGGTGCGIAINQEELVNLCEKAFQTSFLQELSLNEALIGWKEYEMEIIRDKNDNCIVICSIENLDPLGIHTGDSITIAPIQTLTDKEYQKMRNIAFAVVRAIGFESGGANIQFGVHPKTGRMVVIEMNPRVSRSSAFASKATGFPIAKVSAKLAVGYTLDELRNELTGGLISIAFEPVIDYIALKIPYFQFEKFQGTVDALGPQMRSTGEVMAIGRSFSEALLKAMRSIEVSMFKSWDLLVIPSSKRLWNLFSAFRSGMSVSKLYELTYIDPWFLEEIKKITDAEIEITFTAPSILKAKYIGFSDHYIANLLEIDELDVRNARTYWNIQPVFKKVDSCSAEFPTSTSYLYSTYELFCESSASNRQKIMILGSGPNRIGQGIEFDYCCVHAITAFKEMNFETIMVNCNPATVSTDHNYADKLYCSPLTIEDLLPIIKIEKPIGVLLQFGGQTPLNLARSLEKNGVPLLGFDTSLIDTCENRMLFKAFLEDLSLKQPENNVIYNIDDPLPKLTYPLIVRPSFVLGGSGMSLVKNKEELQLSLEESSNYPILIERFLSNAIEIDIDAICDGKEVFIPTIMEQVEFAGVHSGDSTAYFPALSLSKEITEVLIKQTEMIALKLKIKGLINIQFAIWEETVYVLEVNPRASRTLPFLSKATGLDLIKIAAKCIMGYSLQKQGFSKKTLSFNCFFVKKAVFPYSKFSLISLGPEMKSTGEVMGIGISFQEAYAKAQAAAGDSHKALTSYPIRSLQEILKYIVCKNL